MILTNGHRFVRKTILKRRRRNIASCIFTPRFSDVGFCKGWQLSRPTKLSLTRQCEQSWVAQVPLGEQVERELRDSSSRVLCPHACTLPPASLVVTLGLAINYVHAVLKLEAVCGCAALTTFFALLQLCALTSVNAQQG